MPMNFESSSLQISGHARPPRQQRTFWKSAMLKLTIILVVCAAAPVAWAQAVGVETINTITTWDMPWEAFFPNDFDPFHPKELHFEGIATVGGDPNIPLPATLWVQFDYLAASPTPDVIYSPAWGFPVHLNPILTPVSVSWTIPFCPQQVSLHFATDAPPGGIVNIAGEFTHRCIPEPGAISLVGVSAMFASAFLRRRPRS